MKEVCRKLGEWLYNIALALIIYGIISPALRKEHVLNWKMMIIVGVVIIFLIGAGSYLIYLGGKK